MKHTRAGVERIKLSGDYAQASIYLAEGRLGYFYGYDVAMKRRGFAIPTAPQKGGRKGMNRNECLKVAAKEIEGRMKTCAEREPEAYSEVMSWLGSLGYEQMPLF